MGWARWEHRVIELKIQNQKLLSSAGVDFSELMALGDDGWEVGAYVPLPEPDEPGTFATTIGWLVLKRRRP